MSDARTTGYIGSETHVASPSWGSSLWTGGPEHDNPLERLNKEVNRRTDVVGVCPNPAALLRLAGAVLVEAHDKWVATDRRYLSERSMAQFAAMTLNATEVDAPKLPTA